MKALVTLRNLSGKPQTCVYQGRQYVLDGLEQATYDPAIATKFLERCAPLVEEVVPEKVTTVARDTIWLANVTGSPLLPATIMVPAVDRETRRIEMREVENPNNKLRVVSREMKGGHLQFEGVRSGIFFQATIPANTYAIPPRSRVEWPRNVAEWFLSRENVRGPGRSGVIRSREPSGFEPDATWSINEIRAYLRLVDPHMDIGLDEVALAAQTKKSMVERGVTDLKAQKAELADVLRATKQRLLDLSFYLVVDPEYRLPTKEEFNEFLYGVKSDDIDNDKLTALLAEADAVAKEDVVSTTKTGRKAKPVNAAE